MSWDRPVPGLVENRIPFRPQVFRIATSKLDDRLRGYRASALARWFHPPVYKMSASDPRAWPRLTAAAVRPPASPIRPASPVKSPRPLPVPASLPAGTAEDDRNTWPLLFRSQPGRWPVLFPRYAAPAAASESQNIFRRNVFPAC